jgi:hypothetical protein
MSILHSAVTDLTRRHLKTFELFFGHQHPGQEKDVDFWMKFGKAGGDAFVETALMSLPPMVRFEYNNQPDPGSWNDELLQVCLHPRDWL